MVLRSLTWWVGIALIVMVIAVLKISAPWSMGGKLFPWLIGLGMLVTAGLHSILGLKRGLKVNLEKPNTETSLISRRCLETWAWVAGFLVSVPFLGHKAAIAIFIIVFMLSQKEKWWLAAIVSICSWAFIAFALEGFLHIRFPPSLASQFLGF
ncbi:tripartite tricarboxylate transporter TctB family protein [Thermodesulfobacteriota bacterium]